MNEIIQIINEKDNFVITSHHHPDGDAIGSSLALYLALKSLGKKVDIIIDDVPKKFKYLSGYYDIKNDADREYDVGFVLDNSIIDRINIPCLVNKMKFMVVIDHHASNSLYGDINYVLPLSSCSMVIYKLLKQLNIKIDKDIASAIYTGIITDTGCYRNKNVDYDTFVISSELSKIVDVTEIIKNSIGTISKSEFLLRKVGIDNLEFYMNNKIAITSISYDEVIKCNGTKDECSGLVNIPREIDGVEVAVLIRYFPDEIRVSLRSNNIDVNEVAKKFGCGGHKFAAGISFDPLNEHDKIKKDIIIELESAINEWNNNCK